MICSELLTETLHLSWSSIYKYFFQNITSIGLTIINAFLNISFTKKLESLYLFSMPHFFRVETTVVGKHSGADHKHLKHCIAVLPSSISRTDFASILGSHCSMAGAPVP